MEKKQELNNEELEKVSGGYVGENTRYTCSSPSCGHRFLYKDCVLRDDGPHCPVCGAIGEPFGD